MNNMFIETYIALAALAILLLALVLHADRAYQQERWIQRWVQRDNQRIEDEDARLQYLDELYSA